MFDNEINRFVRSAEVRVCERKRGRSQKLRTVVEAQDSHKSGAHLGAQGLQGPFPHLFLQPTRISSCLACFFLVQPVGRQRDRPLRALCRGTRAGPLTPNTVGPMALTPNTVEPMALTPVTVEPMVRGGLVLHLVRTGGARRRAMPRYTTGVPRSSETAPS